MTTSSRLLTAIALTAAAATLAGCSTAKTYAPGSPTEPKPAVSVTVAPLPADGTTTVAPARLDLSQDTINVTIPVGQATLLTAPANESAATWTVKQDPASQAIATYSEATTDNDGTVAAGAVQALAIGTATLKLTSSVTGRTVTVNVTVVENPNAPDLDVTIKGDMDASIAEQATKVAKTVVGMSEQEAIDTIVNAGYWFRVVERDGEGIAATMDYREDRINLVIARGKVTDFTIG